jgi:two-component system cell cycle sensor histidine kinase/response regulator CckA
MSLLSSGLSIDLLVTDLTMPGIGGRELAIQVREGRPEIGVVFISGYAADIGRLDLISHVLFLAKPFSPADLVRAAGKAILRAGRAAPTPVEQ